MDKKNSIILYNDIKLAYVVFGVQN